MENLFLTAVISALDICNYRKKLKLHVYLSREQPVYLASEKGLCVPGLRSRSESTVLAGVGVGVDKILPVGIGVGVDKILPTQTPAM